MGMTASQFNALVSALNSEWERRKYYGDMRGYKSGTTVGSGGIMYASQGNVIMNPFNLMNTHGNLYPSSAGNLIQSNFDYNTINGWRAVLAGRDPASDVNDCNYVCSGLCAGQCSTGCRGGCTGGCQGCGGCGSGCNGCIGSCSTTCGSYCYGGNSCEQYCSLACESQCRGCYNGCVGCKSSCTGGARWS